MSEDVRISKICLKIGRKQVELSVSEAKKLKKLLDEMYGSAIVERHDHWHWRPYVPHWATWGYSSDNVRLDTDNGQVYCSNTGKLTMSV